MGSLWGAIAGDALGVPVEFRSRAELCASPVTTMTGHGMHQQPMGTWSDDGSLLLCTLESLQECEAVDTLDMAERYHRWLVEGHWTAHGTVFDIGIATRQALARFSEGKRPEHCGGRQEYDNGNGSLMRMLPVSLWLRDAEVEEALEATHRVSRITHAHPRTLMVCGFYTLIVRALLEGAKPREALTDAWNRARQYYTGHEDFAGQWDHLQRLDPAVLPTLTEDQIRSTGYSIHTLEASIWCLLQEGICPEIILRAVNLGEDTDTTACVTGGLAGLCFGVEEVPATWIEVLARKDDLGPVFQGFASRLLSRE